MSPLPLPPVSKLSVSEGGISCPSASGPCSCARAIKFHHDSTTHQFLNASWMFVVPLPRQEPIHLIQLLVTLRSPGMWKSLAPLLRPSRSTFRTLETQASYISRLLPESGAFSAINRVVPKRIAVHLSSNFHDLLIVQKCSKTNNVANPDLLP